jgi:serine protease Do
MTDIAVVKVEADSVSTVAKFDSSSDLVVGQTAIAIGSPLNLELAGSVSSGIVSKLPRLDTQLDQHTGQMLQNVNLLQTDAAINPGNSGGALIDLSGGVIGINESKVTAASDETPVSGIGFAITSNDAIAIADQILKTGKVVRPVLGITSIDLSNLPDEQIQSLLKLPKAVEQGVALTALQARGPASNAGLEKYDVITEINGNSVNSFGALQNILNQQALHSTVKLTFYRGGQKMTAIVDLTQSDS